MRPWGVAEALPTPAAVGPHTGGRFPCFEGIRACAALAVAFLPLYAVLIGRLALRHRARTVEFAGGGALFAVGIAAIIAIASGYTEPWITLLPQHLPAFALGILLAASLSWFLLERPIQRAVRSSGARVQAVPK